MKIVRNFLNNLPLTTKLLYMMLILSLAMIIVLFILYTNATKNIINEVQKHTEDLSTAIQVSVWKLTTAEYTDTETLTEYLKELKAKGIGEINIISTDEEVIASSNPRKLGGRLDPKKKKIIIKAQLGEPISEIGEPSKEKRPYNIILPVIVGDEFFGYIHLSLLLDDFKMLSKRNYIERLIATLLVFSLGIIGAIFLSRKYTKPIHQVVEAAKRVATGDLSQTLPQERKDEIGDLTRSFNDMIMKLRTHRELEERLIKAEHLSKIGHLASSIAHEIRNPLNFISLSIDHLKGKFPPEDKEKKEKFNTLILNIKDEIRRLNKLVEDFLNYGKPMKVKKQWSNIGPLLEETVTLVRGEAEEQKITIKTVTVPSSLYVDPELMKTCFLNIILNAFQAMPQGGTLEITSLPAEKGFNISFSDSGTGISKEDLPMVFEPYFTTKKLGIGLGLALTRRIIEEHSGSIEIESAPEKGTTVKIFIPEDAATTLATVESMVADGNHA
ncbi:MAG: HAMP domain-containing protein [Nitrospirae bacterium]|nr:HAMP domain-containing protein [Nitrospirota bacterium]